MKIINAAINVEQTFKYRRPYLILVSRSSYFSFNNLFDTNAFDIVFDVKWLSGGI